MTIRFLQFASLICFVSVTGPLKAQLDYEQAPINYSDSTPHDRVALFAEKLHRGEVSLEWEPRHGYLKSFLAAMEVPVESQTMVFSKTSLQIHRITPEKPRAVYFNDDVYVGWVQRGDVVEISAADPDLGGTFYTLSQQKSDHPRIERETSRCLQCHGSTHTRRVPGHIVRSVYPDSSGQPVFRLGTHLTEADAPFEERWGGWYVTGTHGAQRHMGNVTLSDPDASEELNRERGANLTDLSTLIDTSPYLSPHSDITALMVLQHQAFVHNVLTAANHSGRLTARDAKVMNKALERPENFESESTDRRYSSAAEKVVKALLFCGEPELTCPVKGTSEFAEYFAHLGPFDSRGRSLRELDLQHRLMKYPCSFLVYTDAFRNLPNGVMIRVERRLREILSGEDQSSEFAHLSIEQKQAIREILADTTTLSLN
ncbi:MAG: hypothetical protein KDA81_15405 [Planctomycetaceae bacterium]|nr:hypothetical protein [Planctomycetaceae bacterium]